MRLFALALLASATIAAPAVAADFTQTGPYLIPGTGTEGPASTYPITFNVTGLTGAITDVNFTLTGLSHTFPNDLDILLVGPTGLNVILLTSVGAGEDIVAVTYVIDQQATQSFANDFNPSGTYRPTQNFDPSLSPPAPGNPYGTSLEAFNGTAANGTWSLFIQDSVNRDAGSLVSATLSITTSGAPAAVPEPATWAMMIGGFGLVGGAMRRRRVTSSITYA